jgi:hypothetical protein
MEAVAMEAGKVVGMDSAVAADTPAYLDRNTVRGEATVAATAAAERAAAGVVGAVAVRGEGKEEETGEDLGEVMVVVMEEEAVEGMGEVTAEEKERG